MKTKENKNIIYITELGKNEDNKKKRKVIVRDYLLAEPYYIEI